MKPDATYLTRVRRDETAVATGQPVANRPESNRLK